MNIKTWCLHKTLVTPDSGICNGMIKLTQRRKLYTTSVYFNLSTKQRINVRGKRFRGIDQLAVRSGFVRKKMAQRTFHI